MRGSGKLASASIQKPISQWGQGDIKKLGSLNLRLWKISFYEQCRWDICCDIPYSKINLKILPKKYSDHNSATLSLEIKYSVLNQMSAGKDRALPIAIHAIILNLFGYKVDIFLHIVKF